MCQGFTARLILVSNSDSITHIYSYESNLVDAQRKRCQQLSTAWLHPLSVVASLQAADMKMRFWCQHQHLLWSPPLFWKLLFGYWVAGGPALFSSLSFARGVCGLGDTGGRQNSQCADQGPDSLTSASDSLPWQCLMAKTSITNVQWLITSSPVTLKHCSKSLLKCLEDRWVSIWER